MLFRRNQAKTLLGIETYHTLPYHLALFCRNQAKTLLGIETQFWLAVVAPLKAAIKLKPY